MATAACSHQVKFMFRCRRCRHCLLYDDVPDMHTECALCSDSESQSQVWYLQEDTVPPWIQYTIEESSWTRGKLLCPKCRARLGSFDFIMQPRCRQGLHMLPSVHLVKSRVDRTVAAPPVARVKPFQREEGLWPSSAPETESIQDCPAVVKPASHQNCYPDTNLSGSNFRQNSHIHVLKDSATPQEHVPPREHVPLNCQCSRQEAACFSEHLPTFLTADRVNTQNHSHTCCLASGQCVWPPTHTGGHVFESHPASSGRCTKDNICGCRVRCCHHSCLSEPSGHSEHPSKLQLGRQPIPVGDDTAVASSDSCQGGGGHGRCDLSFPREERGRNPLNHSVAHGMTDNSESSHLTNVVRPELAPLPPDDGGDLASGLLQEDQDDFEWDLLEWDILQELEEMNSSMMSFQTRAEVRRERNHRKRIRRKLRRRGNSHRLFTEGDLKSLPPSKFEELTGLCLGDRSVQEYTICAVCLDLFVNPRACSPCGHLFCEQCLRQLTRFNPTSTPCPLCRTAIEVTIPHEDLSNALQKLFPNQTKQKLEAYRKIKQRYPLPRAQNLPPVWLPLFGQRILSGRNRRRMFWSLQPNSSLDYHDFGRLWVQTLRWRFTVAGYGILALLLVCACSVLVINFV